MLLSILYHKRIRNIPYITSRLMDSTLLPLTYALTSCVKETSRILQSPASPLSRIRSLLGGHEAVSLLRFPTPSLVSGNFCLWRKEVKKELLESHRPFSTTAFIPLLCASQVEKMHGWNSLSWSPEHIFGKLGIFV